MMQQRILVTSENENNETVYELDVRKYATPTGTLVLDECALENAVSTALDYVYYTELADAVAKTRKSYESAVKKFGNGKATREDVESAKARFSEAMERYHAYPSMRDVEIDRFALIIAAVITGTKTVNIDGASYMIAKLRSKSATPKECNDAIKEYVNSLLDIKSVDYVKPYTCGTNLAEAENIQMLAKAVTRRWTEKGIEGRQLADRKVWQQVLLTVFEYGFSLKVQEQATASTRTTLASF